MPEHTQSAGSSTLSYRPRSTDSLCPVCLRRVPAEVLAEADTVVLEGSCPEHGLWRTPIWSGLPSLEAWRGEGASEAVQHTCTAVLEVTRRCDLGCPVCFAESSPGAAGSDPSLVQLKGMLSRLFAEVGAVNLQLSGGEPTMRDDLPAVIEVAREAGFTFVQVNTNGLRLASQKGYAETLRGAGLASVFLQFDGVTDETHRVLRGRPLAAQKARALARCAEAGLAVVLVPTVVAGVNDREIGALVRLAAAWPGVVRGLHLQPISYFGRYPHRDRPRLTLPEVLRCLERQTGGAVQAADFAPSCCEHALCSFRARYWVRDGGVLEPMRTGGACCAPEPGGEARRAVAATSRQWGRRSAREASPSESQARRPEAGDEPEQPDGLTRFLDEADRSLTVSGMLFQDAWNLDLERVRRCCVQVVAPDHGLVSFCLWNLTSESGRRLYPR